jgi:hypothetical protein
MSVGRTVWGPVDWDATLEGMERAAQALRAAGAPPDSTVAIGYWSYRSRRLVAKAPPLERPQPAPEDPRP